VTDNGSEARAARSAARAEPLTGHLGAATFRFEPEMPLDVVMSLDTLNYVTHIEGRIWVEAHTLIGATCDTSCADDGLPLLARACPDETAHRMALKRARRDDGSRVSGDEFHAFHERVLDAYAVTEGESEPSADSPATAGADSSGTASGNAST
jgi:hypothetical protein